ncbi:hypothetical protein V6N11_008783 [Hibiscus sabdariffa]|uniref:Uncharacterized protein n=1 Tax=Hibiscus sabdariffa TaxID=183260 RepID=A0ABR2NQR0_9ROSI
MWKPRSDNEPECCFGADWELLASRQVSTFPKLPKKGGKEGAPRHVMAGDLRVTTKVGKDPGNGIRNEEAEATVKRYVVPYRQKIQSRPSSGLGGKTSKMWGSRRVARASYGQRTQRGDAIFLPESLNPESIRSRNKGVSELPNKCFIMFERFMDPRPQSMGSHMVSQSTRESFLPLEV